MDSTEWEPEVPGQFNTPLRIRRQRAAAEAAYSIAGSEAEQNTATTNYVSVFILLTRMTS
jgi:hypothetical protein